MSASLQYTRHPSLSRFANPPVSEVRIGMVLHPLHISVTELPSLFSALEDFYPVREEAPARSTQVMSEPGLGSAGFRVEFGDIPPLPLIRFMSVDGFRWLEIQSDALTCGWRRNRDGTYPTYEALRAEFLRLIEVFGEYWSTNHDGDDLYIIQAGISYHNDFAVEEASPMKALARAFTMSAPSEVEIDGLPAARTASMNLTFNFTHEEDTYAVLRLNARVETAEQGCQARFNLRFWGNPFLVPGAEDEAVLRTLRFMDEGHDAIVRAFTSSTTPEYHKSWEKLEA
jgi:uncharacterized protein (TIGR04255 family)